MGGEAQRGARTLEVRLRFRFFATLFLIFFGFLMGLGALITFVWSDYSSETDFVFRFYNVFNPCILVDHYPANVVGVVVACAMLFASMGFVGTLVLYVQKLRGATQLSLGVGLLVVVHYLVDLLFLNVFTANLYPHGEAHLRDASGAVVPLTATDVHHLKLHTFFYVLWLCGTFCAMVAVYRVRARLPLSRTAKALYLTGVVAVIHSILQMAQWMVNWQGEGHVFVPTTWVQWLLALPPSGLIPTLHPLAFLLFRFLMPAGEGVTLRFALVEPDDDAQETVDPERWIGLAFRIFGISLLGTYLLQDPSRAGTRWATQMILFNGFSQAPYNYLFVPVFVAVGHALAIGVALTVARSILMRGRDHTMTRALTGLGGLLVVLCWTALWLVIPQFDTRGAQALLGMVLFPLWSLATFGLQRRTVLFSAVWVAALVSSIWAVSAAAQTAANLVIVGLLMFYGELMRDERLGPSLSLRVERLSVEPSRAA